MTESNVCDDNKVNENDDNDDDIKSPDETICLASSNQITQEQRHDKSLAACFKLAEHGAGGFVVKDNLLYHRAKILGQSFLQLVVPTSRRKHVMRMGHDTFGGHMSMKRTKARISYTFYWPTISDDCHKYVQTCRVCQMKARISYRDRVPIDQSLELIVFLTISLSIVVDHSLVVMVESRSITTLLLQPIVSVDFLSV